MPGAVSGISRRDSRFFSECVSARRLRGRILRCARLAAFNLRSFPLTLESPLFPAPLDPAQLRIYANGTRSFRSVAACL